MSSPRTVRAIRPFTAFIGSMVVFNVGDEQPLPAEAAARYVASGKAEYVSGGADIDAITAPAAPPEPITEPTPAVLSEPEPAPKAEAEPAPKKGRPGRPPKARTTDAPED